MGDFRDGDLVFTNPDNLYMLLPGASSLMLACSLGLKKSPESITHDFPPPPATTPAPEYPPVILCVQNRWEQVGVCERVPGGEGLPDVMVMTSRCGVAKCALAQVSRPRAMMHHRRNYVLLLSFRVISCHKANRTKEENDPLVPYDLNMY